jgi:sterol desaturase/sphingolipid hydroxylase (fatty acid hydroxylase superfamily)
MERLWQEVVLNHFNDYAIIAGGTFVFHEFTWLFLNGIYMVIDCYGLFPQYRIHKDKPVNKQKLWVDFWASLKGHFTQLLPIMLLSYPLLKFFGFEASLPLPTLKTFTVQFLIFNIIEDSMFYWVHRWLHTPWAYMKIHKVHHAYTEPYSLAGEIAHPVEFISCFLTPMMVGPVLCGLVSGCHVLTFWIWMFFRSMRGTDAHSGYDLPFHPLRLLGFVYGGPVAHDLHHQPHGRNSMLGGYKLWDWLMGTDAKYKELLRAQQKQQ